MFLQLEHNQELILKELVILKGLFTSQSPSALTGSKPSQKYSDLASKVEFGQGRNVNSSALGWEKMFEEDGEEDGK
ncbi:hypothetical protein C356_06677 [Cryptococcus neoformans c45]|nr:hypothetical protein C356_06677 [Cryptococcus neoformans var. grubii c45]